MKLSAKMTVYACMAFGLVCLIFAGHGLHALAGMQDEAERSLTRGYTGFWLFLFAVAVVFGLLSHLMAKGRFGSTDD